MKFTDLKLSLKNKIENNYLLTGNDEFLLNKSCELILKAINITIPDLNYLKVTKDSVDFLEIVKFLNTMPVIDEKKLIIVNLNIKTTVLNLKELLQYLKNPNKDCVLVIVAGINDKEFKSMQNYFMIVDCNRLPENIIDGFVLNELKKTNTKITNNALTLLNSYCVYDLTKINSELVKLVSFVDDKKIIEEKDVALLVNKTLEFQIYELTENLARKNKVKVFEILENLKSKKENVKTLLPLIYNHFRRLFHVAISKSNKSELSEMLGVKEYAITVAFNQSKLFTKKQLKQIVEICEQLDFELKQSIISYDLAIDYLVLNILNI